HPFLFLIRDSATGSVLFMGQEADPLSKAADSSAPGIPCDATPPVGTPPIHTPPVTPGPVPVDPPITIWPPVTIWPPITIGPPISFPTHPPVDSSNTPDVNRNGHVTPADVLLVINYINRHANDQAASPLAVEETGYEGLQYCDVNHDGTV